MSKKVNHFNIQFVPSFLLKFINVNSHSLTSIQSKELGMDTIITFHSVFILFRFGFVFFGMVKSHPCTLSFTRKGKTLHNIDKL